jgi:hypothetical protein
MGLRFIFMLTRNDRTVADAPQQLQAALRLGVRHIGFKDIGLPIAQLKTLNAAIKAGGATSYLEVVSLDRDSEIVSARAAVDIGVDVLLGGTRVDDVLPVIEGSGIRYYPFAGRITGHPSVLEGSIEEIVESAKAITARDGVHGLDLLAYRSAENVPELMKAVCAAVSKPVFMAGSIDTPERIAIVKGAGAAGFTIGTAALDGKYPAGGKDLASQLGTICRRCTKKTWPRCSTACARRRHPGWKGRSTTCGSSWPCCRALPAGRSNSMMMQCSSSTRAAC